jgi:hypothetical protein
MLPSLHHLGENGKLDSFDLLSERRKRSPPSCFRNPLRAPFRSHFLRPETSGNEFSGPLPFSQPGLDPP